MKYKTYINLALFLSIFCTFLSHAAGLEDRTITIRSSEIFDLLNENNIKFKFNPLTEDARILDITKDASALGVTYLGQIQLKENVTALSALRSIAGQIADSLDLRFGVIADSNTSESLKTNELLLLYHPHITLTLALVQPSEDAPYEVICTYTLKEIPEEETAAK
ncbi:MAG: hypothetical protein V3W20_01165 [Candidatus Neomarinimicrobiota bacterium]